MAEQAKWQWQEPGTARRRAYTLSVATELNSETTNEEGKNPQRLATKRLKPGYFLVQEGR